MSKLSLLEQVKESGEDFEFYPTTSRMLRLIANDLNSEYQSNRYDDKVERNFSILDIGAGNGSSLATLQAMTGNIGQQYAIEKARKLIEALPPEVFIIGTDFHQQTLIDKQVDVVFCNPPYSEFGDWMRKILSEANCSVVYMVVPERWKDDKHTLDVINRRCGTEERDRYGNRQGYCKVLGSDDFLDSEYRKARAKVDILKIKFIDAGCNARRPAVDPFDLWFESNFAIDADTEKEPVVQKEQVQSLHDLVKGQNIIERLEELYLKDFEKLLETYRALEKMDKSLFKELGVDLAQVKGGLRGKIAGLKNLYWNELFNNLDAITSRLTTKSRETMLKKLTAHTSVDYTADNAYAVVIWAIKNANTYFDSQLVDIYYDLADKENVKNYKSNKRIIEDSWRYARREQTHFTLDYRLVLNRYRCFTSDSSWMRYDFPNGLNKEVNAFLNDLCTIGKNLGQNVVTDSFALTWEAGKLYQFLCDDGTLFMDVRAYLKGTVHVRMNQEFMKRLNIEAARLNGWVKSPKEAADETGIQEAAELYGTNFKMKSVKLLPGAVA